MPITRPPLPAWPPTMSLALGNQPALAWPSTSAHIRRPPPPTWASITCPTGRPSSVHLDGLVRGLAVHITAGRGLPRASPGPPLFAFRWTSKVRHLIGRPQKALAAHLSRDMGVQNQPTTATPIGRPHQPTKRLPIGRPPAMCGRPRFGSPLGDHVMPRCAAQSLDYHPS